MRASAPAPSADRSAAPTLPGFSTPSMTTTSGSGGSSSCSSDEVRDADDGDQALRPSAEGELLEDGVARRDGRDPGGAERVERRPGVGPGKQRLADVDLDDLDARLDGPPDLARAVDDREAAALALPTVAKGRRGDDPRVGAAGQLGRGGGGHRWHHAPPGARANAPSSRRRPSGVSRARSPASTVRERPPQAVGQHRGEPVGIEARACARSAARIRPARG